MPPGNAGYTPPGGLVYNLDEARRLLAEAGYPNGQGFPDVSLLYAKRGVSDQVAIEMQALWRRDLGITSIHLRDQEWKVYLNTQQEIDFDLCLSAWIGDYNDPQTFIDMFVTDGGNNDTGWSDPQYDRMLQTSENTADPAKRMQILQDMEKILVEDQVPIVPVYFWVGMSLYYPGKVGGFEPNFVDDHRWGEFYLPGRSHDRADLSTSPSSRAERGERLSFAQTGSTERSRRTSSHACRLIDTMESIGSRRGRPAGLSHRNPPLLPCILFSRWRSFDFGSATCNGHTRFLLAFAQDDGALNSTLKGPRGNSLRRKAIR